VGVCVLIALPFSFARINPLMRPHDFGQQQESQLAVLRGSAHAAEAAIAAQKAHLGRLRTDLARQAVPLQPARDVNRRLAELTELAAGAGLEVSEILPAAALPGSRYDTVPIRIRGRAATPRARRSSASSPGPSRTPPSIPSSCPASPPSLTPGGVSSPTRLVRHADRRRTVGGWGGRGSRRAFPISNFQLSEAGAWTGQR